MKYNLLMELDGLGVDKDVARSLYELLLNVVRRPGQIKIETNPTFKDLRELIITADKYSGSLKYKIGKPKTIEGRIEKKTDNKEYYAASIMGGEYCVVEIIMEGEKAGIYEEYSYTDQYDLERRQVFQCYYDAETLKYLLSVDKNLSFIKLVNTSVRGSLEKKGIEPDGICALTDIDEYYGRNIFVAAGFTLITDSLCEQVIKNCGVDREPGRK